MGESYHTEPFDPFDHDVNDDECRLHKESLYAGCAVCFREAQSELIAKLERAMKRCNCVAVVCRECEEDIKLVAKLSKLDVLELYKQFASLKDPR